MAGEEAQFLKEGGTKVWRDPVCQSTLTVGKLRQAINISNLTIHNMGVTART